MYRVRSAVNFVACSRPLLALAVCLAVLGMGRAAKADEPLTYRHFAANANIDSRGTFEPGAFGFNLADVGASPAQLSALPAGVRGLVWIGQCQGVNNRFISLLKPVLHHPKVFGFYLMDEPDPTGKWATACSPARLKAESDWIHKNDPGAKTFVVLLNLSSSSHPSFRPTYTPANSHIDLFGVDPYPCRTELHGCDLRMIGRYVKAAESAGVPATHIVPVYQAFGGGSWPDDGGGKYKLPTSSEETQILRTWASLIPHPAFDYAYSWGRQNGDVSLASSAALKRVFALHNQRTRA